MILPVERASAPGDILTTENQIPSETLWTQFRPCIAYLSEDNQDFVRAAFDPAFAIHRLQVRKSGEPYITHPLDPARRIPSSRKYYEFAASQNR